MDIFLELLAVGLLIALGDQLPTQVLVYAVISIQESLHSERPITSELYSTAFNIGNKPYLCKLTATRRHNSSSPG